ncbi:MAG: TetR family transcriptional regulator [Pseudonocardiales bacterium]|nr:TetR family transcriptional regulator [Pseudonocardiales bacterium]
MPTELHPLPIKTLRRDAAQNRQRLLDAASQVFAERGLDASVEEVARAAGVGMGTLYRRFPTKDALIAELVRELLEDVLALAQHALTVADGAGLEQFLYACGEAQASNRGCLARMWNDSETAAIKAQCQLVTRELLLDAKAHGRIRADAQLSDIDLLFWSLRGVIEVTRDTSAAGWRRLIALMIAGLRPSSEELAEPGLTEAQAARIRNPRH